MICVIVGAIQVGITAAMDEDRRPEWFAVTRTQSVTAWVIVGVCVLVGFVALNAPGRISDGWDEFKQQESPGQGSGRLVSVAGQNRYAYWVSALDENATKPLTGTGSGTFEFWWARNRDTADAVRDTHSLWFQTLGEVGIVGFALLLAFLGVVLVGGGREIVRANTRRPLLAASMAGVVAFLLTATFDWMWQIPVLAVVDAPAVGDPASPPVSPPPREEPAPFGWPARAGAAAVALVAIIVDRDPARLDHPPARKRIRRPRRRSEGRARSRPERPERRARSGDAAAPAGADPGGTRRSRPGLRSGPRRRPNAARPTGAPG